MTENFWCPTCVVYAALLEAATDGDTSIGNAADSANTTHTVEKTAESDESSTEAPIPDSAADSDDLHPDAKGLAIGEVLGFDRDGTTEYVFQAADAADRPFRMRVFDDDPTLTDGLRTYVGGAVRSSV